MTLFRLAAAACFVIAIVCFVVPTTVGAGGNTWAVGGLLAWLLDPVFATPLVGRAGPPQ